MDVATGDRESSVCIGLLYGMLYGRGPFCRSTGATTPNALMVSNNQSRLSLPPLLAAWLAFLVIVCLALFVKEIGHLSAQGLPVGQA